MQRDWMEFLPNWLVDSVDEPLLGKVVVAYNQSTKRE